MLRGRATTHDEDDRLREPRLNLIGDVRAGYGERSVPELLVALVVADDEEGFGRGVELGLETRKWRSGKDRRDDA